MNFCTFVGRIVKDPELKDLENGKKVSNLTLAVQRSYKNEDGVYEADFIDVTLWNNVASNVSEYCKKGDVVGVKGRLETNIYETEDGVSKKDVHVVAEKLTFLSSKAKDINEEVAPEKDDDYDME